MHKRVGEVEEFSFGLMSPLQSEFKRNNSNEGISSSETAETQIKHLHITIAVTGWLRDEK